MPPPSRMAATETGSVEEVVGKAGPTNPLRVKAGEPILWLATPARVAVRAPGPLVLLSAAQACARLDRGMDLCLYVDLSSMFVLADVRSKDISLLRPGASARATMPAFPGKTWQGHVVDSARQFDERAQTLKTKIEFPNDEAEIWQGMLVNVEVENRLAPVLAIPEAAVIPDGNGAVVFVQWRANRRFEPQKVETGVHANSMVEIRRGLSEGDQVAASAVFLLDSESRLRALSGAGIPR